MAACLLSGVWAPPALAQEVPDDELRAASVEYEGELPPLFDRQMFFGDPQYSGSQLSPNGEMIAFRQPYKDVMNVWVKGIDEPFSEAEPVTADTTRPVSGYFWTHDSERILYVQDKGGNENFHVYAVDLDAERTEMGVPPARNLTPYEGARASIANVPEEQPNVIYVGLNDRSPQNFDLYKIEIDSGDRELVFKNDEGIGSYAFDLEGNLRLVSKQTSTGGTEILRVDGDSLTSVYECSVEESCGVIRFHPDGERVYMSTNKGPEVDLQQLILFNPDTGESEVVESDPEGNVDFGGAEFSPVTDELIATYYVGERVRIYPKTEQFAGDLEFLRGELPEGDISFQGSTEDGRLWKVVSSSDVNPGIVYLFDREAQSIDKLYETRPEIPNDHMAEMQPITYEARDGLEIPAYLTVPKGVEAENLPTVIYVHGGPWARDTWGYSPYVQFLANRGYAVLQPNFRSSTGYGQDFLNAGNRTWGRGAMQHDITDGVQYLIDQGIADPDRVAIFGGSYGGYATLAGVTFTPDLYAAAVPYVAPSNLITLIESFPAYWRPFLEGTWYKRVGDPEVPEEREDLKERSPLFYADQITAPLLVVHGANDPRVKQQESDQIVATLRDQGHPVEYIVAPDEGHGFRNEDNNLALAAKMEAFLAEHVGGRYQTSTTDDIDQRLAEITVDPSTVEMPETSDEAEASKTSALPDADGSVIQPTTVEYTTSLSIQGRSLELTTTRTIAEAMHEDQSAWRIVDDISSPMMNASDTLLVDRATLRPLARHVKGQGTVQLSYSDDAITGQMQAMGQSMDIDKSLEAPVLASGSGMELAMAGLPLEEGYETTLRTFNYQQQNVRRVKLAVTGSGTLDVGAGSFETLTVEVTALDGNDAGTGTYHVMADAPHHVVKADVNLGAAMGGGTATVELTATGATTSDAP